MSEPLPGRKIKHSPGRLMRCGGLCSGGGCRRLRSEHPKLEGVRIVGESGGGVNELMACFKLS